MDDAVNSWVQRVTVALMVATGVSLLVVGALLYVPR